MHSLFEQAIAAHRGGHLDEAEKNYRAFLDQKPDEPDTLALLGVLLSEKGLHADAIALLENAVRLDSVAALFPFYLGNAYMAAGDTAHAVDAFRTSINLKSDIALSHYNLGNALGRLEKLEEAAAAFAHALQLDPAYAEARNNLALIYQRQGSKEKALKELGQAVTYKPDYGEAWLNLCKIAGENDDLSLSLEAGQKAAALMPENPSAFLNLGIAFNRLERHQEAEQSYKTAIKLKPDWIESWDNLAQTYQYMNRLDEAEAAFRKVIDLAGQAIPDEDIGRIDPRSIGNHHWHLAQLELMKGDYTRGFSRYRCRLNSKGWLDRVDIKQPLWQGENIEGKTILILDEEACGDGLMMCRYLPLLKERGAHVKFRVKPVFGPLFKGWDGANEVIIKGEPPGHFDFYSWVFDLPYAFGATLEKIPAKTSYLPVLEPDEDTRLPISDDQKPRIGVLWTGSSVFVHDRRHIPLAVFSRLFEIDNVHFYSLTRDRRTGDEAILKNYPITDLGPRQRHFGDLACFVAQMDLVITCDTALAHLAGGLGKKVWALLAHSSDWRWLTGREDSPWYPTMRLFRQQRSGDWEEVIERIKNELKIFANSLRS